MSPRLLLFEDALGGHDGRLVGGIAPAVNVLGEHPESVFATRRQIGHREQVEPGVTDSDPGGHGQLLFLDDEIGDGRAAVPVGLLPFENQGIRSDLAASGESGRVGAVADQDVDNGKVLAEFVFGCDGVDAGVSLERKNVKHKFNIETGQNLP